MNAELAIRKALEPHIKAEAKRDKAAEAIHDVLTEAGHLYEDGWVDAVEVHNSHAAVETVNAYGLTIRLDAGGNAVSVEPVRLHDHRGAAVTEQEKAPPVTVRPDPESRLEQLLAEYDDTKAKADEAAARLKTITDGIKAEVAYEAHTNGTLEFNITSPYLAAPLRLSYVERWTLDAKRMKAEDPGTYVTYARKGGSWVLKAVQV